MLQFKLGWAWLQARQNTTNSKHSLLLLSPLIFDHLHLPRFHVPAAPREHTFSSSNSGSASTTATSPAQRKRAVFCKAWAYCDMLRPETDIVWCKLLIFFWGVNQLKIVGRNEFDFKEAWLRATLVFCYGEMLDSARLQGWIQFRERPWDLDPPLHVLAKSITTLTTFRWLHEFHHEFKTRWMSCCQL